MNRRQTDILDVGEPTLYVGEQTVGKTTRGRNDRLSYCKVNLNGQPRLITQLGSRSVLCSS